MKKLWLLIITILMAGMLLAACSDDSKKIDSKPKNDKKTEQTTDKKNEDTKKDEEKVEPVALAVSGAEDGKLYKTDVTIVFNTGTATVDGTAISNNALVNKEGTHTLVVTEQAGKTTTIKFTIDKTAPKVTGIENKKTYTSEVTIAFNEGTAKLNSKDFKTGTKVSTNGNYTLVVTDDAGNETKVEFVINIAAPVTAAPTPAVTAPTTPTGTPTEIILSTTTSTVDSGLLSALKPVFEKKYNAKLKILSLGSGAALDTADRGDADVVLAHDAVREGKSETKGTVIERQDLMYNDFLLIGPSSNPAGIAKGDTPGVAFGKIYSYRATSSFVSRFDNSGTHTAEKNMWAAAGVSYNSITGSWYIRAQSGMGDTLMLSWQRNAYTLADRATWYTFKGSMPGMISINENRNDPSYKNIYHVMRVNPEAFTGTVKDKLLSKQVTAKAFVYFMTQDPDAKTIIQSFGKSKYGEPLFYWNR